MRKPISVFYQENMDKIRDGDQLANNASASSLAYQSSQVTDRDAEEEGNVSDISHSTGKQPQSAMSNDQ